MGGKCYLNTFGGSFVVVISELFSSDIYGEICGLNGYHPVFTLTPLFLLTAAGGLQAPRPKSRHSEKSP